MILEHATLVAEPGQQVDDEERQPANDKHAHDDAQRLGGLLLARQLAKLPAQREVLLELMGARVALGGRRGRGRTTTPVYAERELHPSATASPASASRTGTTTTAATTATTAATAAAAATRRGGRQHFGTQPLAPCLRDGRRINFIVCEHHDQERYVERYGGREYQIPDAVGERACVPGNGFGADQPPPNNGWKADHTAAHPHGTDQPVRPFPAHFRRVRERVGDGPVPVQRYHAQVQYRRRAEQHVQRPPDIARVYAERPVVIEQFVHRAHRHHDQPDQEVSERQRSDKIVGGRVQIPFPDHGYDDQTVAENGHHAEQHEHHGQRKTLAERGPPVIDRFRGRRFVVLFVNRIRSVGRHGHKFRRPIHLVTFNCTIVRLAAARHCFAALSMRPLQTIAH